MFDVTLQVTNLGVGVQEDHLELEMTIGLALPHDGGIAYVPGFTVRFPMGKDAAINTGKTLQEKGEELKDPPKKSDLVIPQNVAKIAHDAKAGPDGSKR